MTSTNPAFASNLYDSTYSADSEGQRNPMYEAQGAKTPEEGKSNPLFSSNILDSSGSLQVRPCSPSQRLPFYLSSLLACCDAESIWTSAPLCRHASSWEDLSLIMCSLRRQP